MTVSLKHKFTCLVPDDGDTSRVRPSNWNDEHSLTQASGFVLGRKTAGVGPTEELTAADALSLIMPVPTVAGRLPRFSDTVGGIIQSSFREGGSGAFLPLSDNTQALGAVGAQWSELRSVNAYLSGLLTVGNSIQTTGNVGIGTAPVGNRNLKIGNDASTITMVLAGGNTGIFNGGSYLLDAGGVNIGGFGNWSNIIGGSYDPRMMFYAVDALIFAAGGATERARVSTSGHFGIGQTSPTIRLDVRDTTDNVMRLSGGGANAMAWLLRADNGGTPQEFQFGVTKPSHPWGKGFYLYSNTDARLDFFINGSGNLGLNTSNPAYRLHAYRDTQVDMYLQRGTSANVTEVMSAPSIDGLLISTYSRASDFMAVSDFYANGATRLANNGYFRFFGSATNNFGPNVQIDSGGMTVSNIAGAITSGWTSGGLTVYSTGIGLDTYNYGNTSNIRQTRFNGTVASPTAVASGERLGAFNFRGFNGGTIAVDAQFAVDVDATVSSGITPTRMQWSTRDAAGTFAERMRLTNAGHFGLGTVSPNKYAMARALTINDATATNFVGMEFTTAEALRAAFVANNALTIFEALNSNTFLIRRNGVAQITMDGTSVTFGSPPRYASAPAVGDDLVNKTYADSLVGAPSVVQLAVSAGGTTLGVADRGKLVITSGSSDFTIAFAAAATLGSGWFIDVKATSNIVVTLDPNGAETIDGAATITLLRGQEFRILCNGTTFVTQYRNRRVKIATFSLSASSGQTIDLPPGYQQHELGLDLQTSTLAAIWLRTSINGGTNWATGTSDYTTQYFNPSSGTAYSAGTVTNQGYIELAFNITTTYQFWGNIRILNARNNGRRTLVAGEMRGIHNSMPNAPSFQLQTGHRTANEDNNAVQILPSTGTLTGLIHVWAIAP